MKKQYTPKTAKQQDDILKWIEKEENEKSQKDSDIEGKKLLS